MIAVQDFLEKEKLKTLLIMQVHDELVLEVPLAELETITKHLPERMQSVGRLDVPLVVEVGVGDNWDKAH
jgi:DNA polymerase I